MKFCGNCGKAYDDSATVCPHCGAAESADVNQADAANQQQAPQQTYAQSGGQQAAGAGVDNGGFAWGLLGFCIPLVGLILFLVWKDEKPKTAKAAGIGALISVAIGVVSYILMIIAGIAGAALSLLI